ncbi:MAG: cation diffusion facilitator family transporter [Planctomycetia bacterium]|nr:cation diffusion facilitator family transporter [Planctomycetia bacterium]
MPNPEKTTEDKIIVRLSLVGILGNIALAIAKLLAGLLGHSAAIMSDAVHSLSDVLATFIAYLGVKTSAAPPDRLHPYGHEQVENLTTLALGLALLITGVMLGYNALDSLVNRLYVDKPAPTVLPALIATLSIVSKEAMYWYTRHYALALNSSAFLADAQHHRADGYSSIGALLGILGARLGLKALDPLASFAICAVIVWVAVGIIRVALAQIIDVSCEESVEKQMAQCISDHRLVDRIDLLRTRRFGKRVFVEVEIAVDGNRTLWESHRVAHEVHNAVEQNFPFVKHVMVHVNPTQLNDEDGELIESPSHMEARAQRQALYERYRDAKEKHES